MAPDPSFHVSMPTTAAKFTCERDQVSATRLRKGTSSLVPFHSAHVQLHLSRRWSHAISPPSSVNINTKIAWRSRRQCEYRSDISEETRLLYIHKIFPIVKIGQQTPPIWFIVRVPSSEESKVFILFDNYRERSCENQLGRTVVISGLIISREAIIPTFLPIPQYT